MTSAKQSATLATLLVWFALAALVVAAVGCRGAIIIIR